MEEAGCRDRDSLFLWSRRQRPASSKSHPTNVTEGGLSPSCGSVGGRAKKERICYDLAMPARTCLVTLRDPDGVTHSVEVTAESPIEGAALGLAALKRAAWVEGPGRAATLEVAVLEPVVKHSISVERVMKWLDGVTTSPAEVLKRERLKAMLGR